MAQTKVTHNIENTQIALDAAEIPNLAASKITSGTFADARIAASSVNQHATSFDDNKLVNDISTLGLRVHTQENLNASNTNSASFDVFQDSSGITSLTNCERSSSEFISTTTGSSESSVIAFPDSGYLGIDSNSSRPSANTNWTCECWFRTTDTSEQYQGIVGSALDHYGYNVQFNEPGPDF